MASAFRFSPGVNRIRAEAPAEARSILIACLWTPILITTAYSEGQSLSYSNQDYVTVGFKATGYMGKKPWAGFGPEISFGHTYKDPWIASLALSCESINLFEGARVSMRWQGGTYLLGASAGPEYIRYERRNRWGIAFGGWAGLGLYLDAAYLLATGSDGFLLSGKAKIPVYIEAER